MAESTQHKLDRIRPPRVQITYDVETGGAIVMKELPFVAGIMADLSGKPEEPLPKIKERKFVQIDRDNINDVLTASKPRLAIQVGNKLTNDDTMLNVVLNFKSMDDFEPINIVRQVKPLWRLFEARQRLSDLLGKLDGNDDLDRLLQNVLANTESIEELKKLSAAGSEEEKARTEET